MTPNTTAKIAALNDLCRKAMGIAGPVVQIPGISALPQGDQSAIRENVKNFTVFTQDNDPYGERDFGAFEHNGERIFWKIDYYDTTLSKGCEDASGVKVLSSTLRQAAPELRSRTSWCTTCTEKTGGDR